MMVGNKVDLCTGQPAAGEEPSVTGGAEGGDAWGGLSALRQVPFLESSVLAQEQHAMLLEASARTGASVGEIFSIVTKTVLSKRVRAALVMRILITHACRRMSMYWQV